MRDTNSNAHPSKEIPEDICKVKLARDYQKKERMGQKPKRSIIHPTKTTISKEHCRQLCLKQSTTQEKFSLIFTQVLPDFSIYSIHFS